MGRVNLITGASKDHHRDQDDLMILGVDKIGVPHGDSPLVTFIRGSAPK